MHDELHATLCFPDVNRAAVSLPPLATLGKSPKADVVVDDDTVSRLHASFEQVGLAWVVTDLGSRNGTFVNGARVVTRVLHDGDELRVGRTRLHFAAPRGGDGSVTAPTIPPPTLTDRERSLLLSLCRPILRATMLTGPAPVRQIAAELSVSESAVKKALGRLYDKFGLHEGERRTGRLASEAILRGAVTAADAS